MMTQVGSLATPTPMATIDSPRAMMTIKPCRSEEMARCWQCHPRKPLNAVPHIVGHQRQHPQCGLLPIPGTGKPASSTCATRRRWCEAQHL